MVKLTQTIRWHQPMNCLSVLDHFVGLALKGLSSTITYILNENVHVILRHFLELNRDLTSYFLKVI